MRILAINSSPRTGGQSKTELMLNHLVEGMRAAGGDVDVVRLREKTIKSCIGCFACWTKTPGRCIHKDDMTTELFPKWCEADLAVYATPLYYHTMNAAMSNFKERTLPAAQPFLEPDAHGKTTHPLRYKVPAAAWLSVCGFPEASEFDVLSDYLNRTRHADTALVAEIYRPAAETLFNPFFQEVANDVLEATREAGSELVASMRIAPATMARITQPFVDPEVLAEMGNVFWKTCISEGVTPKTFGERNMVPRPDSIATFMRLMPAGLNAAAAAEEPVILQFDFSGEVEGACHFTLAAGQIEAHEGAAGMADLTIEAPFEVWMDIMTRKADGQQAFLDQKYTVHGDLALMLALFKKD
jgi:hypothetical protein